VVALVDNATFSSNNGDLRSSLGPCALIRIDYPEGGSIHIVLSTSRNQVRSPIQLVLWITPSAERYNYQLSD
jgi:microcystin degradation protein MlrC